MNLRNANMTLMMMMIAARDKVKVSTKLQHIALQAILIVRDGFRWVGSRETTPEQHPTWTWTIQFLLLYRGFPTSPTTRHLPLPLTRRLVVLTIFPPRMFSPIPASSFARGSGRTPRTSDP